MSYDGIEMRHNEAVPVGMCWCLGLAGESVPFAYRQSAWHGRSNRHYNDSGFVLLNMREH